MPAVINLIVEAQSANMQIAQTTESFRSHDKAAEGSFTKIKENWVLVSQVANVALTQASRAAEGTALAGAVQVVQTGLQVVQTEIAIGRLGILAIAALTPGIGYNPAQAALYAGLIGLLQGTVLTSLVTTQQAQQRNTVVADELARQLESYI